MTFYVEQETETEFSFSLEELVERVACKAAELEACPYELEVNVLITDNQTIREYNKEHRDIDKSTDVLSFPNVDYEAPADFSKLEEEWADCFHPDTGELLLGDIVISYETASTQAKEYGHSLHREIAFLIAHSMLHLFGYDHMDKNEALIMESKQKIILEALGITREE